MAKLVGLGAKVSLAGAMVLNFHIQFATKEALQGLLFDIGGNIVGLKSTEKHTHARLTHKDAASIFPNTIHFRVFGETIEEIGLFFANSIAPMVDELLASSLVEVTPKKSVSIIPSFAAEPKVIEALESCPNCTQPVVDEKKAFWIRRNRELMESAHVIAKATTGASDKGFTEMDFNVWFASWVTEFSDHEAILRKMSTINMGKLFPWFMRKRMLMELSKGLSDGAE